MRLAGFTTAGPRPVNEDSFYCRDFSDVPSFSNEVSAFAMVSDGMGGHDGGDVASRLAAQASEFYIANLLEMGQTNQVDLDVPHALKEIVANANEAITQEMQARGKTSMGATFVGAFLSPTKAWIAHVGDSRAYLIHHGETIQITKDHSAVGRMLSEGLITEKEAQNHPRRNVIERALGMTIDDPEITEVSLSGGDALLLCSDGLSTVLSAQALGEGIMRAATIEDAPYDLVSLALKKDTDDNTTAVVMVDNWNAMKAYAMQKGLVKKHSVDPDSTGEGFGIFGSLKRRSGQPQQQVQPLEQPLEQEFVERLEQQNEAFSEAQREAQRRQQQPTLRMERPEWADQAEQQLMGTQQASSPQRKINTQPLDNEQRTSNVQRAAAAQRAANAQRVGNPPRLAGNTQRGGAQRSSAPGNRQQQGRTPQSFVSANEQASRQNANRSASRTAGAAPSAGFRTPSGGGTNLRNSSAGSARKTNSNLSLLIFVVSAILLIGIIMVIILLNVLSNKEETPQETSTPVVEQPPVNDPQVQGDDGETNGNNPEPTGTDNSSDVLPEGMLSFYTKDGAELKLVGFEDGELVAFTFGAGDSPTNSKGVKISPVLLPGRSVVAETEEQSYTRGYQYQKLDDKYLRALVADVDQYRKQSKPATDSVLAPLFEEGAYHKFLDELISSGTDVGKIEGLILNADQLSNTL
ncbi:MAG: protein phosphatase 2C domain-containing protein [Eggerthellaceae bacterium]|nr:protein phosphatase 2C domain-containing protein [Eggerthellaceae bacterium]